MKQKTIDNCVAIAHTYTLGNISYLGFLKKVKCLIHIPSLSLFLSLSLLSLKSFLLLSTPLTVLNACINAHFGHKSSLAVRGNKIHGGEQLVLHPNRMASVVVNCFESNFICSYSITLY